MRIPFFSTKSISPIPDDDAALLEAFTGSTPGAGVTAQSALHVAPVAAAVKLISESCAALDVNIVDGEERVNEHPALTLLRGQVNGWTSGYDFIRDMVAEALLHDSGAMAWVNRVQGEPREIINYRRGTIGYQEEETRELTYRVSGRPVPASDIVHLRGPFQKCPVSLAREAIGAALVMEAHASRLFKNGARPGGVIEVPKGIGEKSWKAMKAGWRAAQEGADNTGKTAILFDGATFKQMQLSSVDAQFLEMRRFQIEEIGRAFNVSPGMLGDLTKSSYANASQKQLEFLQYAVEPWLKALEGALDRALLSDEERGRLHFKFDRDDLTRASLTERATAINSLIASETINPNEGREWLGLPPYEGGDEYGNRNITVKPANDNRPADEEAA
ncbi:phage portal protein, HK97 family [Afipia felis]|uniref:Phage portal protein, HK97 family n=1 Tax=Afipia felis TaxID=1035 RepID=A0A090N840_AFIFE|nr:phage portal protein [Afipia felis]CEG09473.1 phage portal protein, HK97 family [Afipia felis]